MKTAVRVLGVGLVLLVGWLAWHHFFHSEESRVRRLLRDLAELASVPEKTSILREATVAADLRGYFTTDVEVEVDAPLEGRQVFNGREELVQAIVLGRQRYVGAQVEFFDPEIVLAPDRQTGTAEVGLKATRRGSEDILVMALKLTLRREDQRWRIARAESVEVLKR